MTSLLDLDAQQKATDPAKYSIQSRADAIPYAPSSDVNGAGGVFWITMGQRLDAEPKWNPLYPNWRDRYLREFSQSETMAASAKYSMKTRIGTLNYALNGPPRAKKFAQELLNNPGLGDTLSMLVQKVCDDLDSTDNGAFIELWRPGNPDKPPPKGSPVLGFAHMDSCQCWRSFDPEYPVWYTNPVKGEVRKIHKDRVVIASDNPQSVELARGIGFCAISRALRMVRVFRSMQIYLDEKVSGNFTRALGAISGVSAGQVKSALRQVDAEAESKGFVVYKDIPFLIDPSTEGKNEIRIMLQDLASIPDGFVFRDDADLYAYILAFAFGVDAREFWPATQSGATKADATVQNMKARGRGLGNRIQTIETMLRACLPETVEFEYDFTDDDQDKMEADIWQVKTTVFSTLTRDGAINALEERALAISEGIIDGKLLEGLDLPTTNDTALNAQDTPNDALQSNTDNNAAPTDGMDTSMAALKTVDTYRRSVRANVRALWLGQFSIIDFYDAMGSSIRRYFPQAWDEGAAKFGIGADERSDDEEQRLTLEINTQISYILPFAQAIAADSKANGGALTPLFARADLWANTYDRIVSLAGTMAAADMKGEWVLGDAEHCDTCLFYAGRVYRNSIWQKYLEPLQLLPKMKGLMCKGYNCACMIVPTDKPITRGRPPIFKSAKELHEHTNGKVHEPLAELIHA